MSSASGELPEWTAVLVRKLLLFGHRNWIVVADAAYPAQSAPGVTTIFAGGEPVDVVRHVLAEIAEAKHVRAKIYTDRELSFVSEQDAPGADAFRKRLAEVVGWSDVQTIAHEEIIQRLDDAARRFEVLIVKTALTIPYTSIFVELDCGYWSADAEARLRSAMR